MKNFGTKNLKKLLFSILPILILSTNFSFSQSSGSVSNQLEGAPSVSKQGSAAVLDNFNKRKMGLISNLYSDTSYGNVAAIDGSNSVSDTTQTQLDSVNAQLKTLSQNFNDIASQKQRTDSQYQDLKNTIAELLASTTKINEEIKLKVITISQYEKKITLLKSKLDDLKTQIDDSVSSLNNYTKLLYKVNNDFYDSNLKIDDFKLLVGSDSIATSLSNEELYKSLALKIDDLIGVLNQKQQDYDNTIIDLQDSIDKHKAEIDDYKQKIEYLASQKDELQKLLEYFQSDKTIIDKRYADLVSGQADLEKQRQKLIEMSKNNFQNIDYSQGLNLNSLVLQQDDADSSTFFSWPLNTPPHINTFFRDPQYKAMFGSDHVAIDIRTPMLSVVYAPANGVVYQVTNQTGPALNWILMAHKYGYVTEYLHLYDVFVKKGDYVRRGQPIALSSGAPGARGSGPMTTGPHLHWGVIKNMTPIDPLSVTDLSVFNDSDTSEFSTVQKSKYQADKATRLSATYDMSKVRIMPGATISQRRDSFLSTYASSNFNDSSIWQTSANKYNIDVDFGICIAFAESTLGNNLSSKYNLGNVGNNDRGDRVNLANASSGIDAIYSVLDNQYLGQYLTMDKLSRWGNSNGQIYASSSGDWQKNVNKCLKAIKGFDVPADFAFRTLQVDE